MQSANREGTRTRRSIDPLTGEECCLRGQAPPRRVVRLMSPQRRKEIATKGSKAAAKVRTAKAKKKRRQG